MLKAAILSLSLILPSHSWYPIKCCSDNDCAPVACDELQEQNDGSFKYRDMVFEKEKVKASQDNKCHVCYIPGTADWPTTTYCVFILPSA